MNMGGGDRLTADTAHSAFRSELPSHPFNDPFSDGEFGQFRATRGDPSQQLGSQHVPDRRRPPDHGEREPTSRPVEGEMGVLELTRMRPALFDSKQALVAELRERDPVVDVVLSRTISLIAGSLVEALGALVVTQNPQS